MGEEGGDRIMTIKKERGVVQEEGGPKLDRRVYLKTTIPIGDG